MLKKIKNNKIDPVIIFGVSCIIFLSNIIYFFQFGQLFNIILILNALMAFLFIVYSVFIIYFKYNPNKKIIRSLISKNIFFYLIASLFVFQILVLNFLNVSALSQILIFLNTAFEFVISILFIFIFLGVFLLKTYDNEKYRKNIRNYIKLTALMLFAISIILFSYFVFSGIKHFVFSDEQFFTIIFLKQILLHHNPYTINQSNLQNIMVSNFSQENVTLPSFNTNNKIITAMDYPAMFFLFQIPFYFLSKINLSNIFSFDAKSEFLVYVCILFFTIAFLLNKRQLQKPILIFVIILISTLAYNVIGSSVQILLISLLLIAYFKLDNKYIWIILGIVAAIDELAFLPVLFLIIYSFNNFGIKRGFYNLIGSIFIFIVLNSYFLIINGNIIFNTISFMRDVFLPLNSYIIPSSIAPFGFFIVNYFNIPLSYFKYLFFLSSIALIIIFIRLNKKQLIPLFSLIPLLFLQRAIISYFAIFVLFLFVSLCIEDKKKHKNKTAIKPAIFYILLILCMLCFIALLIFGHYQYLKNYNLYIKPISYQINKSKNISIYNLLLIYKNTRLNYVSTYVNAYIKNSNMVGDIGIFNNSSILNKSVNINSSIKNSVNPNFIFLNKSLNNTKIEIVVDGAYPAIKCVLYNNQFYYNCPLILGK